MFHWLEFQYEPFGYTSKGTAYSKGKIDMAVLLDQERERYLAYECKRLNIINNGSRSSLATPYVMEGLSRFVTEQYAENLPVGCMLGYVLDGDVPFANSKVRAAIKAKECDIGLTAAPTKDASLGIVKRFSTCHLRPLNGKEIEIRHALLPFPKTSHSKTKATVPKRSEAKTARRNRSRSASESHDNPAQFSDAGH